MEQARKAACTTKSDFIAGEDFVAGLPVDERAAIDARAVELIAEHLTLRDLRKAHDLTQERMALLLGVAQENISRLEQRTDMLLSTLASYVKAMGGELKLVVAFPDRQPVQLTSFAEIFARDAAAPRLRRRPQPVSTL